MNRNLKKKLLMLSMTAIVGSTATIGINHYESDKKIEKYLEESQENEVKYKDIITTLNKKNIRDDKSYFILGLAVLDYKLNGENRKCIVEKHIEDNKHIILSGIDNNDILIYGTKNSDSISYSSIINENLKINNIEYNIDDYFENTEWVDYQAPSVTYLEIKDVEDKLNNSYKLARK